MRQKRIQELTGDRQRLREIRLFGAKANPEIALHVEMAAGQQKHTLLVAQAGGEPSDSIPWPYLTKTMAPASGAAWSRLSWLPIQSLTIG